MAEEDPHLETRRKRALLVAGAIGVAAIAWNADDWWGWGDTVSIEVSDEVRESVREAREEAREARDEAREERIEAREEAGADIDADSEGLPRITEEDGVLRVETPDGRTVTISDEGIEMGTRSDDVDESADEEASEESSG